MLVLLILGFVLLIVAEFPSVAAVGKPREMRAFWALLAVSFLFCLAMVRRWPMPNPTRFVAAALHPVSRALGLK
ncbi:MAG TPA: hypothetical protein VD969_02820 [Symbiobacteriaceae bacterium]|nr:hypothetical protein [Symbiobacteriaceae bacterium]